MNDTNLPPNSGLQGGISCNQFLSFQVNELLLAIEILRIREIIEFGKVTVVPMMEEFICGVINLRGAVVSVVDLRARFSRGKTDVNHRTCIVIVESHLGQDTQVIGFMVDAVNAVIDIPSDLITDPPQFGAGIKAEFLRGIGRVSEEFIMVLDVEKMLDLDMQTELAFPECELPQFS